MVESRIVKKSKPIYPRLMLETNQTRIILFTGSGTGTVVHSGHLMDIGDYCSTWDMDCFTEFTGTIELKN